MTANSIPLRRNFSTADARNVIKLCSVFWSLYICIYEDGQTFFSRPIYKLNPHKIFLRRMKIRLNPPTFEKTSFSIKSRPLQKGGVRFSSAAFKYASEYEIFDWKLMFLWILPGTKLRIRYRWTWWIFKSVLKYFQDGIWY